jgi:hypothetical protein
MSISTSTYAVRKLNNGTDKLNLSIPPSLELELSSSSESGDDLSMVSNASSHEPDELPVDDTTNHNMELTGCYEIYQTKPKIYLK